MSQLVAACCFNIYVRLRGARGIAVAGPLLDAYLDVELVEASAETSRFSEVEVNAVNVSLLQRLSKVLLIIVFAVVSIAGFLLVDVE